MDIGAVLSGINLRAVALKTVPVALYCCETAIAGFTSTVIVPENVSDTFARRKALVICAIRN